MASPVFRALSAALLCVATALAHAGERPVFDAQQSQRFRAWFTLLVAEQLHRGPNPRWTHRDCAGLVRFAVDEALRNHDTAWRKQNGLSARRLPPELELDEAERGWRENWRNVDGSVGAFASAYALVQENSDFVSTDLNQAQPGDLLFFDQGDDQHLMVWMGDYIAYHTGNSKPDDNGLRAVSVRQLMAWRDVRWQPRSDNPNFIGVFRLHFLSR
jgi:hypothetical protein